MEKLRALEGEGRGRRGGAAGFSPPAPLPPRTPASSPSSTAPASSVLGVGGRGDPRRRSGEPETQGTLMNLEVEILLQDLGDESSRIFLNFMMRTAKFEELVNVGLRFLTGYYQELEIFRKPRLHKMSDVVDAIIETNHTDRMKAYVEAGCKLPHLAVQNISNLHSCKEGLQEHLKKVKVLLDELECLKDDAIGIAQNVSRSTFDLLDRSFGDGGMREVFSEEEEIESLHDLQGKSMLHASMMAAAHGMLKLDYAMQENIIKALNLDTSLAELESYCLMWGLCPFMNENIMHRCWRFVQ